MSGEQTDIRNRAIGFLARREHSAKELFHKLARRGYDEAEVREVIELLVKEGLQSDNRYTEIYTQTRIEKGYGPVRIRQELQQRGIADPLIAEYLSYPEDDWLKHARRVRRKKFGDGLPENMNEKMKQSRFLQQRGFSGEQIRKTVRTDEE